MERITEEHIQEEALTPQVEELARPWPFVPLPPAEESEGVLLVSEPTQSFFRPWMLLLLPIIASICCLSGLGSGLLVGWELWPVEWDATEWRSAHPYNLREDYRRAYVQALTDLYAYDMDDRRLTDEGVADLLPMMCQMQEEAASSGNGPETIRLYAVTIALGGCP